MSLWATPGSILLLAMFTSCGLELAPARSPVTSISEKAMLTLRDNTVSPVVVCVTLPDEICSGTGASRVLVAVVLLSWSSLDFHLFLKLIYLLFLVVPML